MNFLQLAQAVKRESGLTGSVTGFVNAIAEDLRIFSWVNWAARDITLSREDWRWRRASAILASTTDQTNTSAAFGLTDFASWKPSNNVYRPSAYRVADTAASEHPLQWLDYDTFMQRFGIGTQTPGVSTYWTVSPSDAFMLGPAPDTEHYVRADYVRDYTEMTVDADTPLIPARFHMIIVWAALMEYGGFDAASEVYQRAEKNRASVWAQLIQSQTEPMSFTARSLA